jgi:hypothetical protein
VETLQLEGRDAGEFLPDRRRRPPRLTPRGLPHGD